LFALEAGRILKIQDSSCGGDRGELHYEGSLTVSSGIAELVGLLPYEKILVGNLQNGEREMAVAGE
jgi:aspartate 1-decarboxylase